MTTLVLGPSLGTSAAACWGPTVALLSDELEIVTWELPGHGDDHDPGPVDLTVDDLATKVLAAVEGDVVTVGADEGELAAQVFGATGGERASRASECTPMGQAIVDLLPSAVGVALSPVPIAVPPIFTA